MYLIGIMGLQGSGKDTLYKELERLMTPHRVVRLAFADALKEEVARACGTTVEFINEHKKHFRLIMQGWGTNFRRELFGDEYWIKQWMIRANSVSMSKNTYCMIVTDVRFLNEAQCIKDLGGRLIRIYRNAAVQDDAHQSETEMQDIQPDFMIANHGNIEELQKNTITLLNQLKEKYLNGNKYHTEDTSKTGAAIIHPTTL